MSSDPLPRLSAKSLFILKQIAAGRSYSRIVDSNPEINYHDIFFAAEETLWLDERLGETIAHSPEQDASSRPTDLNAMERAKLIYPKAYAPWTAHDDEQLGKMFAQGICTKELAEHFQRQPSAIRSRLAKLGHSKP